MIPSDDPVRLLSAFVEGMDLSELYHTYDRIRKNQASPRQMLKIMVYAAMNGIFSSRDIETACRRDINFMFLLEGMPAPDHATIARFLSLHLSACSKDLLAETASELLSLGEISGKTVFIDGTKIEANANRYTFVWKKSVTKNQQKLFDKAASLVAECETMYGVRAVYNGQISLRTLKRLRKKLLIPGGDPSPKSRTGKLKAGYWQQFLYSMSEAAVFLNIFIEIIFKICIDRRMTIC